MSDKGNCEHGEFVLTEGCPQCIAKVGQERKNQGVAFIEAEPLYCEGITGVITAVEPVDTKINLCDTCIQKQPVCIHDYEKTRYGDGIGNDNVIECNGYSQSEVLPPGGLAESARAAGEEVKVVTITD